MVIRELELASFRNYPQQHVSFTPGVNWISGRNGQGKTNLAEALFYLCNLESFRTRKASQLLKTGVDAAVISGVVESRQVLRRIRVVINRQGRQVFLDRQPLKRTSEYLLSFMSLVFTPEDVNLFRSQPGERRRFFNRVLSFMEPGHLEVLQQYAQALANKNVLLKRRSSEGVSVWNELLVRFGVELSEHRRRFVENLNPLLSEAFQQMSGRSETLRLEYRPTLENDPERALVQLRDSLSRDLHYGHSMIGPHRDDFRLSLDHQLDREFFSQGEFRLTNLALKMAINSVLSERYRFQPVLVLDDLFSELDPMICEGVLTYLGRLNNQVFITSTVDPLSQTFPVHTLRIDSGKVHF
ncbi:MAG: DNA replication/repair protein RecF [bacterium]